MVKTWICVKCGDMFQPIDATDLMCKSCTKKALEECKRKFEYVMGIDYEITD